VRISVHFAEPFAKLFGWNRSRISGASSPLGLLGMANDFESTVREPMRV
jgi:hypothetical protein